MHEDRAAGHPSARHLRWNAGGVKLGQHRVDPLASFAVGHRLAREWPRRESGSVAAIPHEYWIGAPRFELGTSSPLGLGAA
jgi:hypothetical protein